MEVHWIHECFRHARSGAWNEGVEAGRGKRGDQWTSEVTGCRIESGMTPKGA
jgi:hypothetical protein